MMGDESGEIFAVGYWANIYHRENNVWELMDNPEMNTTLTGVWGFSGDDVYTVGAGGVAMHYDGTAWQDMEFPGGQDLESVWGFGKDEVIITSIYGDVYTYNGTAWTWLGYNQAIQYDIWGTSFDNIYVSGSGEHGGWIGHWNGLEWREIKNCSSQTLTGIMGAGDGTMFAVGRHGTVLSWDGVLDQGVRIIMPRYVSPGDPFSITGYLDNNTGAPTNVDVYFILDIYGYLWFWDDWVYSDPDQPDYDYVNMTLPAGTTELKIIPEVSWPDTGDMIVDDLWIYSAMVNPETGHIQGEYDAIRWGFGPQKPRQATVLRSNENSHVPLFPSARRSRGGGAPK